MAGWPPQQEATCHFYFYLKKPVWARLEIFGYSRSTLKGFVVFERRTSNVEHRIIKSLRSASLKIDKIPYSKFAVGSRFAKATP